MYLYKFITRLCKLAQVECVCMLLCLNLNSMPYHHYFLYFFNMVTQNMFPHTHIQGYTINYILLEVPNRGSIAPLECNGHSGVKMRWGLVHICKCGHVQIFLNGFLTGTCQYSKLKAQFTAFNVTVGIPESVNNVSLFMHCKESRNSVPLVDVSAAGDLGISARDGNCWASLCTPYTIRRLLTVE